MSHPKRICPAFGKECNKKNHFASQCRSELMHSVEAEEISECFAIGEGKYQQVKIGDIEFQMQIDNGTSVLIILKKIFGELEAIEEVDNKFIVTNFVVTSTDKSHGNILSSASAPLGRQIRMPIFCSNKFVPGTKVMYNGSENRVVI